MVLLAGVVATVFRPLLMGVLQALPGVDYFSTPSSAELSRSIYYFMNLIHFICYKMNYYEFLKATVSFLIDVSN